MITIESTDTELRVTVPKDEVPAERLNAFLDWLRFESSTSQSHLTEQEANRLADEVKADWWARNKHRFIAPGQP